MRAFQKSFPQELDDRYDGKKPSAGAAPGMAESVTQRALRRLSLKSRPVQRPGAKHPREKQIIHFFDFLDSLIVSRRATSHGANRNMKANGTGILGVLKSRIVAAIQGSAGGGARKPASDPASTEHFNDPAPSVHDEEMGAPGDTLNGFYEEMDQIKQERNG